MDDYYGLIGPLVMLAIWGLIGAYAFLREHYRQQEWHRYRDVIAARRNMEP